MHYAGSTDEYLHRLIPNRERHSSAIIIRDAHALSGFTFARIESYRSRTNWSGRNIQQSNRFRRKPAQQIGEQEWRGGFELKLSIEGVVPDHGNFRAAFTRRTRNNYRSFCNARNRDVLVK